MPPPQFKCRRHFKSTCKVKSGVWRTKGASGARAKQPSAPAAQEKTAAQPAQHGAGGCARARRPNLHVSG